MKDSSGTILLHSGLEFNPLWPTPDSFTIEDFAHGIHNQHRFGGHTIVDYYVAQHSIIMARWFLKRNMIREAKEALVHEGSEGLGLGDMPTPIKYLPEMEAYRVLCKNVDYAVRRKVGLLGQPPKAVKELDTRMYVAEAKLVYRNVPQWILDTDTSDIIVKPYKNKSEGKKAFMRLFKQLFPDYKEIAITY